VSAAARGEAVLSWMSHPVRTQHDKTAILFAVLAVTGVLLYLATGSVGWSLIGDALLLLGVYDFLLPTTFRLDGEGASRQTGILRRTRRWEELRSYYGDANGVLLSTFAERSRMEAHRGIYLRFEGNRDQVMRAVEAHLGKGAA